MGSRLTMNPTLVDAKATIAAMSLGIDAHRIRKRRGAWRSCGSGCRNQCAEIDFAERGCRGSRRRRGNLENPQAAVCVINHRGDVEIFVHSHASRQATRRGARGNTSRWNWTAEQRRCCGAHVDKLNGTCAGFRDYRDAQNSVLSDSAGGRTGRQS